MWQCSPGRLTDILKNILWYASFRDRFGDKFRDNFREFRDNFRELRDNLLT